MQNVDGISKHGNLLAPSSANVEPRVRRAIFSRQPYLPQNKVRSSEPNLAGQGYQKLKALLTSHGLPEMVVNELVEHHTPITYPKGSMIFLQGAPTDIIYWVSSGLVVILCPEREGGQIQTS